MAKKLNTLSLSGLMIGPILGSGIVLLPPIAIRMLGDQAIIAWIIIMLLGAVFAYVFTRMSLLAPSNEGVSVIIGEKLGQPFRELSSNYLTSAVCFGPVAVLFTASGFICGMFPEAAPYRSLITFLLLLLSVVILFMGITAMGGITLILSSLTALVLVAGSIYNLANETAVHFPSGFPGVKELGSTLLLLFWAIIGWEVIGNYVEEVQNPEQTIMRAMKISIAVVVLVYLLSTFTLQNSLDQQLMRTMNASHMNLILVPLFGGYSSWIIGLIATGLCFCTLIMILGAVTRQIAARAEAGSMPAFFRQQKEEKSPKRALLILSLFHCLMITLVHFELITIEWLVGIANTFFICNALLGLTAGFQCISGFFLRSLTVILILCLCTLLIFSPFVGWILFLFVTLFSIYKKLRTPVKSEV